MREDMHKVLVERPRYQGLNRSERKGRAPKDIEDHPTWESMSIRYVRQGSARNFGDHLRPLIRYLDKQVGRPWNKVFSEIAKESRLDGVVRRHLRLHALELVAVDPPLGRGGERTQQWRPFHVDPRTGLLRKARRR